MPLNAQVRDRIAVVASQTALMARAYGEWSEADWQRDTFCAGWTAADAVAHLVTGADFYTQVIESGRTGKPGKPWGVTNVEEFRVTPRRRRQEVDRGRFGGRAAGIFG